MVNLYLSLSVYNTPLTFKCLQCTIYLQVFSTYYSSSSVFMTNKTSSVKVPKQKVAEVLVYNHPLKNY